MPARGTLLLADPSVLGHRPRHAIRPRHPDGIERYQAILDALEVAELSHAGVDARAAWDDLARVHTPAYLDRLRGLQGETAQLDEDTGVGPDSVDAARTAAALTIEAVRAVMAGEVENAFALGRPPGHHATADAAMGFCLLSNVAIAIEAARANGLRRALVLDWDVHHGNGTQAHFYGDPDVMVVNIHQLNHFPHTGATNERGRGRGRGTTVNVPLAGGCGDADYLEAFDAVVRPAALRFEPQIIVVSAGFDAHRDDPLGDMRVTTQGFAHLCARTVALARQICGGRLAMSLEGGYDPGSLGACVVTCARVLRGEHVPEATDPRRTPAGRSTLEAAVAGLK